VDAAEPKREAAGEGWKAFTPASAESNPSCSSPSPVGLASTFLRSASPHPSTTAVCNVVDAAAPGGRGTAGEGWKDCPPASAASNPSSFSPSPVTPPSTFVPSAPPLACTTAVCTAVDAAEPKREAAGEGWKAFASADSNPYSSSPSPIAPPSTFSPSTSPRPFTIAVCSAVYAAAPGGSEAAGG